MFVTEKLLKKLKACEDQLRKFAVLFPDGVELSRAVIVRHAEEFDWLWCASNLASAGGRAAYCRAEEQAWAVYLQAIAPALAVYDQAVAPTLAAYKQAKEQAEAAYQHAAYQHAVAEAWAAHQQAKKSALAAYHQAADEARAAYNLAHANTFADIMGL